MRKYFFALKLIDMWNMYIMNDVGCKNSYLFRVKLRNMDLTKLLKGHAGI